ncbi:hypothetical protein RCL1_002468 [Eukaryota sp. TZLM3-RCL]
MTPRRKLVEPKVSNTRYRRTDNVSDDVESPLLQNVVSKFRDWRPSYVCISPIDSAPELRISSDFLTVSGNGGYRMAMATHPAGEGFWYFEVRKVSGSGAARIGWSSRHAELQAPCGFDDHSFSIRSLDGSVFHQSKRYEFATLTMQDNDVLGCLMFLNSSIPIDSKLFPDELIGSYPGEHGSQMLFFLNGESLGSAFSNFPIDEYFPAVSLYKDITVSVKFTPPFDHFPSKHVVGHPIHPLCDAFFELPAGVPFYQIQDFYSISKLMVQMSQTAESSTDIPLDDKEEMET